MSVYYVLAPELDLIKIGFASDPKARFSKIQSDSPVRLVLLGFEEGDEATEAARHVMFGAYRQRGEWFRHDGTLRDFVQLLSPLPVKPDKPISLNAQLVAHGISSSYSSMILSGQRKPSRSLAIHIFRKTGWKHAIIAELTDEEIDLLEKIEPWAPSRPLPAPGGATTEAETPHERSAA